MSENKASLSGYLPGREVNGLSEVIESDWFEFAEPGGVYVVAKIERDSWQKKADGKISIVSKIRAIEVLDVEAGEGLLKEARRERTGDAELPIEDVSFDSGLPFEDDLPGGDL